MDFHALDPQPRARRPRSPQPMSSARSAMLTCRCRRGLRRPGRPRRCSGWDPDVAGLAVHAVLRVDLQAVVAVVVLDELVHAGRTVARFRAAVLGQVDLHRHRRILQRQVHRLVLVMVGVRDEHRAELVERELAVGLGVIDARALRGRLQAGVVGLAVAQRPGKLPLSTSCSMPVMTVATVRPFLNHCLKLRALFSSSCSQEDLNVAG